MSSLNRQSAKALPAQSNVGSPIRAERKPSGRSHEGGVGYAREEKSELFLLAVSSFYGEDTFYEKAKDGGNRYARLIRAVAVKDPDWTSKFLKWLRNDANMRTAAIVGAAEYAVARRAATQAWSQKNPEITVRKVVASVLQRADEPGEFIAYWRANVQASLPSGVQRGIADAVLRLYTEYSYLKWDSTRDAYRFADVLNLIHAGDMAGSYIKGKVPWKGAWQKDLFWLIQERAYGRSPELPDSLLMLAKNQHLRSLTDSRAWLDPMILRDAGMNWEDVLSAMGSKISKRDLWTALAPSMGVMALIRNLRNMDEAGVSDEVAEAVGRVISDPEQVAKSKQLPLRYLAAYRAVKHSLRWSHPLEKALQLSLSNVPLVGGRTLILVDTSTSMRAPFSKDGTVARWDAAVLFALALAERCEFPEVVSFSSSAYYWGDKRGANTKVFARKPSEALLAGISRWERDGYFLGGGTDTALALRQHYKDHDRAVIVTDEQEGVDPIEVSKSMRQDRPLHTINLAGYAKGHAPSTGLRFTFGGLTDQTFLALSLAEAGAQARWPWED